LAKRENAFQQIMNDTLLLKRIFQNQLENEAIKKLEQQPFCLYAFRNNELVFWNNNNVVSSGNDSSLLNQTSLFYSNGVYLKKCYPFQNATHTIVALFPILYKYPFENQYLVSHLAADKNLSTDVLISQHKTKHAIFVKGLGENTAFYFEIKNTKPHEPDSITAWLLVTALTLSVVWFSLTAIELSRRKHPIIGFGLLVAVIVFVCCYVMVFGLPFQLSNTQLFSPSLYASSSVLSSLGNLLFYLLVSFWLLLFLLAQKGVATTNKIVQVVILFLTAVATGILCFMPLALIRSLVHDSKISFDVAHFYSINYYTIIGLITVLFIAAQTVLGLYYLNRLLRQNTHNNLQRVAHFVFSIAISFLFVDKSNLVQFGIGVGWVTAFLLLFNFILLQKANKYFSTLIIMLAAFVIVSVSVPLLYYTSQKHKEEHKSFAEHVANQRDNMTEFLFEDIANNIQRDKWLQNYLDSPHSNKRIPIDEHLTTSYLSGSLNHFYTKLLLFNKQNNPVYNSDTLSFDGVEKKLSKADSISPFLFHFEEQKTDEAYASLIPIKKDNDSFLGFVFLDLKLKSGKQETVYPELLQPENQHKENYPYAVYINNQLKTQSGNFNFPFTLNKQLLEGNLFQIDSEKSVVLIDHHRPLVEAITLISYLFGLAIFIALLLGSVYVLKQYLLGEKNQLLWTHFTLQKRIQYSMLSLVILAFVIIGIVTVNFFISQSKQGNKTKLQSEMVVADRSIQQYFLDTKVALNAYNFDKVTEGASFKNFINRLVEEHGIDINVYNKEGTLNATSQEGIYNKAILARLMIPNAFYKLSHGDHNSVIQEEKIGKLNYLSSYLAFQNEQGETVGYINIPFFSSQKELSYQISNIVVALIDLFAIIFLISGLFTVIITRWLTNKLQMIIDKFKGFNLQANELLVWPYKDEIGLLVNEYNKMVSKVEEQAHLLAKSERESAWREMAKQVAHEIKNPLTPMKLNVQYLQQAINNNNPNTPELVAKVSQSMIEQIDNLSHIASAFSDFAKMPEAAPEHLVLNSFLKNAIEIFKNNIEVHLSSPTNHLKVFIDKSQFLRVITNLIQNAFEAIPENRKGKITLELIEENGKALLKINDNGSGIPADVVEHIFSPYFTTKGSGTGLGLAMTKRIVEFWNGKIWFETSEEGTTFFIELPLA
jgi:signal transduction histidine kinase